MAEFEELRFLPILWRSSGDFQLSADLLAFKEGFLKVLLESFFAASRFE